MAIVIKNGTLVTANETFQADILVEGEKIVQIGNNIDIENAEIVNADGKLVMPGGVDVHTHFDLPFPPTVSSDDHYTGHWAAAWGGTTTVIDFVPQAKPTLAESVSVWRAKVDPKAGVDFGFHMNITHYDEKIASEIPNLPEEGISSVKMFTAYNGKLRLQDGDIFRVMRIARDAGLLVMLHAENGDVIETLVAEARAAGHTGPEWHALTRPAWGATEASLRGAALAAQAGAPLYIVHMNTTGEVDMLEYARQHGLPVMGETCPQYLFFTTDHLGRPDGAKWVCSPPLRRATDNRRLWDGLSKGIIQTIGSDHCPFFFDGSRPILYDGKMIAIPGKELGRSDFSKIPNGLPSVGDRLIILWSYGVRTGKLTPNQFVALNCTNPARIFGLYPRKGTLLPGSDADILVWDPEKSITYGVDAARHRTDYNLFEGWEVVGGPEKVFLRGNLIVDNNRWAGRPGMGKFIPRPTHNPIL